MTRRGIALGGVLAVALAWPVRGEIGEARDQFSSRYGHGKEVGDSMLYLANGYDLTVHFDKNGKSIMEIYAAAHKVDGTQPALTADDITKVLQMTSHGNSWQEIKTKRAEQTWLRSDVKMFARFEKGTGIMVFLGAQ